MWKKPIVMALAVFVFCFGSAVRSNAGTEIVEPYSAPAPSYNFAPPPPRPVFYPLPLPVFNVVIAPGYGYYGSRYGYYGARRFHGRRAYWRSHHHWR